MSFRCGNCNDAVRVTQETPRPTPVRRVTQIRHKDYVGGGQGWEIVKEKQLCATCGEATTDMSPKS